MPDYRAVPSDVFRATAVGILNEVSDLDILHSLRFSDRPSPEGPSWVPDFGTTNQGADSRRVIRARGWNVSRGTSSRFKIENNRLRMYAQSLDTIVAVSKHMPDAYNLAVQGDDFFPISNAAKQVAAVLKSRRDVCPRDGEYINGQSAHDAYWQTYTFLKQDANLLRQQDKAAMEVEEKDLCDANIRSDENMEYYEAQIRDLKRVALEWRLVSSIVMARTRRGYYCWVPYTAKYGDEIVLLPGGKLPFAIRHVGSADEPSYEVLGGCYVHGIMFGEAWNPSQFREIWFE